MASASPITNATVVLDVGASPNGQASFLTLTLIVASAHNESVESIRPLIVINGTPSRLINGNMVRISAVSPELDNARTTSLSVIIPKSP